MQSKLALWSWFALGVVFAGGCGSSASGTGGGGGQGGSRAAASGGVAGSVPDAGSGSQPSGTGGDFQPPGVPDAAMPTGSADAGSGTGGGSLDAPAAAEVTSPGAGAADGGAGADTVPMRDAGLPSEAAGGSGSPDARALPDGPGPDAQPAPNDSGGVSSSYNCTLMIGIQATEEWWIAGFETMVDNSKWELVWVHSGFVELWANPNDPVWSTSITSPCAQNATKPDRVIFLALNFDYTTSAEWTPVVNAAVANLEAKYPSAKRIELMSFIRAPGDNPCSQAPAKRSTITPAQDQAMAAAAAASSGLVVVAPKFEAKTCAEFSSNPPHPTTAGAAAWAKMMADYYR